MECNSSCISVENCTQDVLFSTFLVSIILVPVILLQYFHTNRETENNLIEEEAPPPYQ